MRLRSSLKDQLVSNLGIGRLEPPRGGKGAYTKAAYGALVEQRLATLDDVCKAVEHCRAAGESARRATSDTLWQVPSI